MSEIKQVSDYFAKTLDIDRARLAAMLGVPASNLDGRRLEDKRRDDVRALLAGAVLGMWVAPVGALDRDPLEAVRSGIVEARSRPLKIAGAVLGVDLARALGLDQAGLEFLEDAPAIELQAQFSGVWAALVAQVLQAVAETRGTELWMATREPDYAGTCPAIH